MFDASHPREKPCGGGVTGKALALLPAAPDDDPLPARWVDACRFESGSGEAVRLRLARPVAVARVSSWMRGCCAAPVAAGARHVAERVVEVDAAGLRSHRRGPLEIAST